MTSGFTLEVLPPAPLLEYGARETREGAPLEWVPASRGGMPDSCEVAPDLPSGLSLTYDGAITGVPAVGYRPPAPLPAPGLIASGGVRRDR